MALWWAGKRMEGGKEGGVSETQQGKVRKGTITDMHLISITEC
jgi:hypothetical protein